MAVSPLLDDSIQFGAFGLQMLYLSLQPLRHIQFKPQWVSRVVPVKQDPANGSIRQNVAMQIDPRPGSMETGLTEKVTRDTGDVVFSQ